MPSVNTNETFRIAVVGGGIGGLTAAAFLRAPGRDITIIEASSFSKEIGASISLQPNASKIFEKSGFGADLTKAGAMVDSGFQMFRTDGTRQMQIPSKRETNFGGDRLLFHRVDLHEMLKTLATREDHAAGPPATLRLSSRVASIDCEEGIVHLESGEDLGPYDLVIGADGIHSKVRDSVLDEHIKPKPTGLSAYRMIIPAESIKDIPHAYAQCTQETWTSMLVGQHCRVIMGPCRAGELLSIVALVPDENMHESSENASWTTSGSPEHLQESYKAFPPWTKDLFSRSPNLGLWQLRDIDPLSTWIKGRVVLIGDSAHAMLPTQGQGASQSIEDAEALRAFFANVQGRPTKGDVAEVLQRLFKTRHTRASLIQAYSRQQAKPATDGVSLEVNLNPGQFHVYNANYEGALDWEQRQAKEATAV